MVTRHDIQAQFLGTVKEFSMVTLHVQAQGVVKANAVGAKLSHHAQVISALFSPLLFVPYLQHILRWPAMAPTSKDRARQSSISNTAQRLQWRHATGSTGSSHNNARGDAGAAA